MKIIKLIVIILAIAANANANDLCGWHDYGNGTILYNGECSKEQMEEVSKRVTYLYLDKLYGRNEYEKLPPLPFRNNGVLDYSTMQVRCEDFPKSKGVKR
jgi:hypothetical protein